MKAVRMRPRGLLLISLAAYASAGVCSGIPLTQLDTVIVVGTRPLDDAPVSATQGTVTAEQLAERPISRSGELLEFVPGLMVTQHSGEGKANQYFLRGFNLDHGTDFATFVDGMPVNMRSHGHGQGYADANFIIPELIGSLEYRKGPYYAEVGDFSAAGSADLRYKNELPKPIASYTLGEYGLNSLLLAGSTPLAQGTLLAAVEGSLYEAPYTLPQRERKLSGLIRYNQGSTLDGFTASLMGYSNQYVATDQIPQRAIDNGSVGRYGFIDPSDGGRTHRISASAEWRGKTGNGHWNLSAYAIDYRLDLYSNFTYFLDDPVNGDQFNQFDQRQVYGLNTHRHWVLPFSLPVDLELGLQSRYDHIDRVGLYKTAARQRLSTVREDGVRESSVSLYASSNQKWAKKVRTTLAARVDTLHFDVDSDLPANSGSRTASIASPKFSLVIGPWAKTDYFLNFGYGFHSNDARGITIKEDPANPGTPQAPVSPLARARGLDLGLTTAIIPHVKLSASLFSLRLASELVYIGDAGLSEASGSSRRCGLELAAYYTPFDWLIVDADYAYSRARLASADGNRIPNALDNVFALGFTLPEQTSGKAKGLSGGLRLRHLGPAALIEDNSARSRSTTVVNAQLGYRLHPKLSASLALLNAFNSRQNDITYFYTSRLAGEDAAGVDDFHLHPVEPRNIRLTLTAQLF